jgi:ABC-type sugar transport system ATPase subunit
MDQQKLNIKEEILNMRQVSLGKEQSCLKNFRLRVCKGELVELLGITGAGKTALYNYLLGNEALHNGTVVFKNRIYQAPQKFENTRDVVCIGKKSSLLPGLSVAENICIISQKRKVKSIINRRAINYRVNLLLRQYVKGVDADTLAGNLTITDRHMVELLRAVENEVDLVYLDDIFETYGQSDMARVASFLGIMKERGITIISAKRGRPVLDFLGDRAIVLRNGSNVRTFYKEDYKEDVFLKWMAGTTEIAEQRRYSYMQEDMVFYCKDISSKHYVQNFSMEIRKGEIVGFYDMNNYANIEIVQMILGEKEIVHGTMFMNGEEYHPGKLEETVKHKIGYIPGIRDESGLVETLGFAENMLLPIMSKMSLYGVLENKRVNRYIRKEYLEEIGLQKEDQDRKVSEFDIYVKANIIMHKWILAKPNLLICGEICDEADVKLRNIIFRALEELVKNKTAIILTSHNIGEINSICDTIYLMNTSEVQERVKKIQVIKNNPPF